MPLTNLVKSSPTNCRAWPFFCNNWLIGVANVVVELFQCCFWKLLEQYFANLHCLHCIKELGVDSTFSYWKHDFSRIINASSMWDSIEFTWFLQYAGIRYIVYVVLIGMAWLKIKNGVLFLCIHRIWWVVSRLGDDNTSLPKFLIHQSVKLGTECMWSDSMTCQVVCGR